MKSKYNQELNALIDQAYSLFSSYSFGQIIAVHHGICCLKESEVISFQTLPINSLSRDLIFSYLDAEEDNQTALIIQMKYLMPKILELLTQNEHIAHSTEISLDKCRCDFKHAWTSIEIDLIQRFALCFFQEKLTHFLEGSHADSYMIMFYRAGLNILPLLNYWKNSLHNINPMLNLLALYLYNFSNYQYHNAFANGNLTQIIMQWLNQILSDEISINTILNTATHDDFPQEYQYMVDHFLSLL